MSGESGYFDIQVNGYAGVDFNSDELRLEDFGKALAMLGRDGVAQFLPTIITDSIEVMCGRLRRLAELREQLPVAKRMIAGLHIEGPFINETAGYRGAHPVDAIHAANCDEMKILLDAGGGLVKLATLAPERDGDFKTIDFLAKENVKISAGHTDASLDQLKAAVDHGLTLFTHVGNACPMQMHRHENIINRALSLSDKLFLTFIADGTHIPLFALKNYLRIADPDRAIVVTDAIAPAGLGPGRYKFARWDLLIEDDLVARAPDRSHFVGSAITMRQSAANLKSMGLSDDAIIRLTSTNPRRALGLSDMGDLNIARCDILSSTARSLIETLNAELSATYPEQGACHFRLDADEVAEGKGAYLVAWRDGKAIGCGAVRRIDRQTGELKRMYVAQDQRGGGVGRAILNALEVEAGKLHLRKLVLETGVRQHAAIALYQRAGFSRIEPFGEYTTSPLSLCMAKDLR